MINKNPNDNFSIKAKIIEFPGTVFNAPADAIVNTINTVGFMGKGLALEFRLRYPRMFEEYAKQCAAKEIKVGEVRYYKEGNKVIVNFPTKGHYRFPSNIKWIEKGLEDFCKTFIEKDIKTVAFPKLGTSNGGLSWDEVKPIMLKYLSRLTNITVFLCLDEEKQAEGIEKQMLDRLNKDIEFASVPKSIRIKSDVLSALERHGKFDRFWKLNQVRGITAKSYEKFFRYYYEIATQIDKKPEQGALF